jgi:hypothetical protein
VLRAIIKTQERHGYDGASTESFQTIDFECPEIEAALLSGGMNETSYRLVDLAGVEVLRQSTT